MADVTKGLLVRLEAQPGKDDDVEEFLRSALPAVSEEPDTVAWFAVRFGPHEYGIVDFFPDDAGRQAHLNGLVAQALGRRGGELFEKPPEIINLDGLASKLPDD